MASNKIECNLKNSFLKSLRFLVSIEGLIIIFFVSFTIAFSYFSYMRYLSLTAPSFDLGVKIQSIFTALGGIPYSNPNYVLTGLVQFRNFNAIHFSPLIYALSFPMHFINPPLLLFAIQWSSIAAASTLLYLLGLDFGLTKRSSFGIFLISLFYVPTLMSGLYDMHFLSLYPFATLLIYYSIKHKRWRTTAVGIALGFSLQESFMLLLPFIAAQIIIDQRGLRNAFKIRNWEKTDYLLLLISIVSVLVFFIELRYMQTLAPQRSFLITSNEGYGLSFTNLEMFFEEKITYFAIIFGLLLFIPLLSVEKLIIALPGIILIMFSDHVGFAELQFQYSFVFSAGVFISFVSGLKKIQNIVERSYGMQLDKRENIIIMNQKITINTKRLVGPTSVFIIVVLFLNMVFSPVSPVSSTLPSAREIEVFEPPSNLEILNTILSRVPSNASVLTSDFIFPHLATDENAYPILHQPLNGRLEVVDKLPSNFTPEYVLIFPTDFSSVQQLVKEFPSDYGVLADGILKFEEVQGFHSFLVQDSLILYRLNYRGPGEYLNPLSTFLPPQKFILNTGTVVRSNYINYSSALYVNSNNSTPFTILHGPSTATYAFSLLPGMYRISLAFEFIITNKSRAASNTNVIEISAYSNSYPVVWAKANVTRNSSLFYKTTMISLNVSTIRSIYYFSIAIYALKPGYGFYFYGVSIVQLKNASVYGYDNYTQ